MIPAWLRHMFANKADDTQPPVRLKVRECLGRWRAGRAQGADFRDNRLIPALRKGSVVLDLDGSRGYGSSFFEEVFGGLARSGVFTQETLRQRLHIVSNDDPSYRLEALQYLYEMKNWRSHESYRSHHP